MYEVLYCSYRIVKTPVDRTSARNHSPRNPPGPHNADPMTHGQGPLNPASFLHMCSLADM